MDAPCSPAPDSAADPLSMECDQGVIEIELEAVGIAPAECDRQPVEIGLARIHPHRHRAALLGEERVASGNAQTFAGNVFAGDAVGRVQAVQETASENAVDAIEVIRGRAAREIRILVSRPNVVDERQIRNQAGVVHHFLRPPRQRHCCKEHPRPSAKVVGQVVNGHGVLLPRNSRTGIFVIFKRRIHVALHEQPARKPADVADFHRDLAAATRASSPRSE